MVVIQLNDDFSFFLFLSVKKNETIELSQELRHQSENLCQKSKELHYQSDKSKIQRVFLIRMQIIKYDLRDLEKEKKNEYFSFVSPIETNIPRTKYRRSPNNVNKTTKPRTMQIHDQHGQSAFKPRAGKRLKRLTGAVVVVVAVV